MWDADCTLYRFPCGWNTANLECRTRTEEEIAAGDNPKTQFFEWDPNVCALPPSLPPPSLPPQPSPPPPSPPLPSSPPSAPSLPPGAWALVFRQTDTGGSKGWSSSWLRAEDEWSVNPSDASAAQFSVLDTLEDFRGGDCALTLRLSWPLSTDPLAQNLTWRQRSNPVLQASCDAVEGYEELPASPLAFTNTAHCPWGGLQRSCNAAYSLLDGCVGSSNWWFSVGARYDLNGIVAVYAFEGSFIAPRTELYAYKEEEASCASPPAAPSPTPPAAPPAAPPPVACPSACASPCAGHAGVCGDDSESQYWRDKFEQVFLDSPSGRFDLCRLSYVGSEW